MTRTMLLDRGTRALAERIAHRKMDRIPVVIEMTAWRRGLPARDTHIDSLNFFDGVMDRLDRAIPRGWRTSPTWSELGQASRRRDCRCLYLYAQGRLDLAEMLRIDDAAHAVAGSMNVRFSLALAPGIVLSSVGLQAAGSGGARDTLLGLVADDPDLGAAPGRYSIRARWIVQGRPSMTPRTAAARLYLDRNDRLASSARLYLTLYRRRPLSRRTPLPGGFDDGGRAPTRSLRTTGVVATLRAGVARKSH